jgi:hypothetical protein
VTMRASDRHVGMGTDEEQFEDSRSAKVLLTVRTASPPSECLHTRLRIMIAKRSSGVGGNTTHPGRLRPLVLDVNDGSG